MVEQARYGSWRSPITPDWIVAESLRLGQACWDQGDLYWTEGRPQEKGPNVLIRRSRDGLQTELTPDPWNVRTRVHEYGGGAYWVSEGIVYFCHFADQRLYRLIPGSEPLPLTEAAPYRYADGVVDRVRRRILCVREDHSSGGEPVNCLVSIDLSSGSQQILAAGHDFYANPRLSPDGQVLVWLTWEHPQMPWDGTELWQAEVAPDGRLRDPQKIAGGPTESIFQPQWSPEGMLHFISDRSGWWNFYRWDPALADPIQALYPLEAEFGEPQWVFGLSTYGFCGDGRILACYEREGISHLAYLDPDSGRLEGIPCGRPPYTQIRGLQVSGEQAVFLAGSPTESVALVCLELDSGQLQVLARSNRLEVDPGYVSIPQAITFPTGAEQVAYGFFYPPKNQDFVAPAGEKPPLLVKSHGGPTGATSAVLNLGIQYWTSRGIAVLDVNYRGSTGYGRAYRDALKGKWGLVDVEDCICGAKFLADQGQVDGERLMISGGSAGGYTTLAALTFHEVFKAGASYYGVSDLEALAQDTHKFESRYLDNLIGPYPERRDLYQARSPIHHLERLCCPVIFFQGLEDAIVPPNQAEAMVAALKTKGLPVAYVPFEGEQHGFRQAANIKRALEAELYFYAQVFGFLLADAIEPVLIHNLSTSV
ncbi:S9 family peptidase [Synechococcus sp. Nb3U1]|uniref:dipeptidyl-peptidase 5 n=1 Tax=Synechococcus sp. Nb3U1 TaxID=1914529 RepID=UPI001F2A5F6B|nr:S9 family peptidase [Synechococcus sp. Nb3U1]MCF2971937.1 S9 family peptidase [Synechococcus sp. Nb3U1]